MTIDIRCQGAGEKAIDELKDFQGNLKKLSDKNYNKLKKSILDLGFIAPLFVWENEGDYLLLDGHQRLKTLIKMRQEGVNIPLIPVNYIYADDIKEAKKELLHITSRYGEFDQIEYDIFTEGIEDISNSLNITEIDVFLDSKIMDFSELENQMEELDDMEQYIIKIAIPKIHKKIICDYLFDGKRYSPRQAGMEVMKKCGLL